MAFLPRAVTKMISSMPLAMHSSTFSCTVGLSPMGNITFGLALVAGRNRVPSPATGMTALRTRFLVVTAPDCKAPPAGRQPPFGDESNRSAWPGGRRHGADQRRVRKPGEQRLQLIALAIGEGLAGLIDRERGPGPQHPVDHRPPVVIAGLCGLGLWLVGGSVLFCVFLVCVCGV